jgi:hypothetical protein
MGRGVNGFIRLIEDDMDRRRNQRWYDRLSIIYTLIGVVGTLIALISFLVGLSFRQVAVEGRVDALEEECVRKEVLDARLDGIAKAVSQVQKDISDYNKRVDQLITWTTTRDNK